MAEVVLTKVHVGKLADLLDTQAKSYWDEVIRNSGKTDPIDFVAYESLKITAKKIRDLSLLTAEKLEEEYNASYKEAVWVVYDGKYDRRIYPSAIEDMRQGSREEVIADSPVDDFFLNLVMEDFDSIAKQQSKVPARGKGSSKKEE